MLNVSFKREHDPLSFWPSDSRLLWDSNPVNEMSHSALQWTDRQECRQQREILRVRNEEWNRSVLITLGGKHISLS